MTARKIYPQLDSMRAVASIAVVATHTCFWAGVYTDGVFGAATQRLEAGVAIFFVLSGFLLSRPYLLALKTAKPHGNLGRYLFKRAARILPVYWVSVAGALILIEGNRSLGPRRWIQNFTLTDLYSAEALPKGLTQMWSLSVEVSFYILLPLLMLLITKFLCRQRWRPGMILALVFALCVANLVSLVVAHSERISSNNLIERGLNNYIGWFALGIALAVFTLDGPKPKLWLTRAVVGIAQDRAACWGAAAALFVVSATPIAGSPLLVAISPTAAIMRSVLYSGVAFLLLLPCVLGQEDTRTAKFVGHPYFRHLGHISYSLFCCHVIVLELVFPHLGYPLFQAPPVTLFVVILASSLLVAEVLYRLVELPSLRLKSWRSKKTTPTNNPRTSATQS